MIVGSATHDAKTNRCQAGGKPGGVADDLKDRIFFPLVSGREGGHGVGLTIAQTFITQHHGTIELESRPGHTCFSILLPID